MAHSDEDSVISGNTIYRCDHYQSVLEPKKKVVEPVPKPWPGSGPIFRTPALQGSAEWRKNSSIAIRELLQRSDVEATARGLQVEASTSSVGSPITGAVARGLQVVSASGALGSPFTRSMRRAVQDEEERTPVNKTKRTKKTIVKRSTGKPGSAQRSPKKKG